MKPKAILISTDFRAQIEVLKDKEAGELFKALFRYADEGTPLETGNRVLFAAFEGLRMQIDNDAERHAEIARKRSEAGKRHKGNQYTRGRGTNGTNGTSVPSVPNTKKSAKNRKAKSVDKEAVTGKMEQMEQMEQMFQCSNSDKKSKKNAKKVTLQSVENKAVITKMEQMEQMFQCSTPNNNNNIYNIYNTSSSSPLTAPAHACEDALDIEAAAMLSSPVWLDNMMAKYNLTREQIAAKVEAFKLDCRCRGVTGHDTQKDAFQHFNNWLIKTLNQKKDETTTGTTGLARDDARRSEREQRLHEYAAVAAKFRAESEADLASRGGA